MRKLMEKRCVSQPCFSPTTSHLKKTDKRNREPPQVLVVQEKQPPRNFLSLLLEAFSLVHWRSVVGWILLSTSTVFLAIALRAARQPALSTYLIGWPTSELPQFIPLLQVITLRIAASCGTLRGLAGKVAIFVQLPLAWQAMRAFHRTFHARAACRSALEDAGIVALSPQRFGMLVAAKRLLRLVLPLPRFVGMGVKVHRDIPYAANGQLDHSNSTTPEIPVCKGVATPSCGIIDCVAATDVDGKSVADFRPNTFDSAKPPTNLPLSIRVVKVLRDGAKLISHTSMGWQHLDVYVSGTSDLENATSGSFDSNREMALLPVLLVFHGGGWVCCDKNMTVLPIVRGVAATGRVIVVNANYRLAPEAPFPAQLVDAKRALAWVHRNIHKFGGDAKRIVVCGESAGGHLAALMALTQQDPRYQPGFEHEPTTVVGCVDLYGYHDLTDSAGHTHKLYSPRVRDFQQWLLRKSGHASFIESVVMQRSLEHHQEDYERSSPLFVLRSLPDEAFVAGTGDNFRVPPFMVVCNGCDVLIPVDEIRDFFLELQRRRSAVKQTAATRVRDVCIELENAQHGVGYIVSAQSAALANAVVQFVCHVTASSQSVALAKL